MRRLRRERAEQLRLVEASLHPDDAGGVVVFRGGPAEVVRGLYPGGRVGYEGGERGVGVGFARQAGARGRLLLALP